MSNSSQVESKGWGVKPRILAWIIPIFLVTSSIVVIFNYMMAREFDRERIKDYVQQRRMDLIYLTSLPSLRMYLMNLKLGLAEEAAFIRDGVQLYHSNYLKNRQEPFDHILSLVSLEGEELLRVENGEIKAAQRDFLSSDHFTRFRQATLRVPPSLPEVKVNSHKNLAVTDVFPVFSEINDRIIGGMVFEYQVPVQEFMLLSRKVFLFNMLLGILSVSTALIIIYLALGFIISPLRQLTDATQKMLSGDLSKEIEVQGYGEVKTLSIAFEDLRSKLESRIGELGDNAKRLEAIIDSLPVATFIVDSNKKVIYWNKAIEELTGLPREAILGKGDLQYAEPFYGKRRPILIDLVLGGQGNDESGYLNLKKSRRDKIEASTWCPALKSGKRLLYGSASVLSDEKGTVFGAIESISDMTENYEMEQEKKELQAQLLHAQKLKAIGTLAGGVAHDFNNIIHAIQGYTDILLRQRSSGHPDYTKLLAISKSAKRASELTNQLLLFSRKAKSELRPMDLNLEIREVNGLLERIIPKMIEIELLLSDGLHPVEGDSLQIEQALVNLAINARDAMAGEGKITIETENVELDEKFCELHPGARVGSNVVVHFGDTGEGVEEEILSQMFEPFFTTKDVGEGTGLGLATVYGIMENHQGCIICTSEVGKGATFSLYFPASSRPPKVVLSEEHSDIDGGEETILLVDDDAVVRALGEDLLTAYGYMVIEAVDGEQGLELYKQKRDEIDLIILDMIMPGMGGERCLDKLLELNPEVKVIIASGYTHEEIPDGIMALENVNFIAKPYDVKQLFDLVSKVLERG